MESDLRAYLEENRRHFDVVAERMESQVRLMAEGVSALQDRLDRMEENLREETLRSQRELSSMIKFSYAELDRRIGSLEERFQAVDSRLKRLEASR